jgi:hypothetical protein
VFGIGLASAILLDATVVQMVPVPAVMQLLGSRNWWIPNWLERILPRLDVERVALGAVPTHSWFTLVQSWSSASPRAVRRTSMWRPQRSRATSPAASSAASRCAPRSGAL